MINDRINLTQVERHRTKVMQKMLVTLRKDDTLIFGGNSEPAALAQLYYAAGGDCSYAAHCISQIITCRQTMCKRAESHAIVAAAGFGHDIHLKLTKLIQGILEQGLGVDPGRCHCVVSQCCCITLLCWSKQFFGIFYRACSSNWLFSHQAANSCLCNPYLSKYSKSTVCLWHAVPGASTWQLGMWGRFVG